MRKCTALLLAALMLLSLLAACSEKNDPADSQKPAGSDGAVTAPAETEAPEVEYLGEKNLDGFVFRVNARGASTGNGTFVVKDLWVEEMTGEVINDAVFERNTMMESKYNFTLEQVYSAANQLAEIRQAVSAGDEYQAAIVLGTSVASLAQEGALLDLFSLPYIDFTKEWWDQNALEAYTIMNRVFFMTGDMNTNTFDRTCVTTFSKSLISDNGLENPYELVREGKWTLSKLYEMALVANRDADGNGTLTAASEDTVGFFVYTMAPLYYFYGMGERITTMNGEGVPELTVYNDRSVEIVDQMFQILNSKSNTQITSGLWADMKLMFTENRALFANVAVSDAKNTFREQCEEDFGFLPIAKFTEDQSRYYNLVATQDWVHLWCVPITCTNEDAVGFLFEAFAYHSKDTLRRAYYDITLSGKVVRDRDSNEMLDLIFANRVYDVVTIYDWGGLASYFTGTLVTAGSNNFSSFMKKVSAKAEKSITDTIEAYKTIK